jgi:hypothetical protein
MRERDARSGDVPPASLSAHGRRLREAPTARARPLVLPHAAPPLAHARPPHLARTRATSPSVTSTTSRTSSPAAHHQPLRQSYPSQPQGLGAMFEGVTPFHAPRDTDADLAAQALADETSHRFPYFSANDAVTLGLSLRKRFRQSSRHTRLGKGMVVSIQTIQVRRPALYHLEGVG